MEIILYILIVSSVTFIGSLYAKKYNSYDGLLGIYITFTIMTQILATKIANFEIFNFSFTAPSAMIIFGITFLITDIVNEKFGRYAVHKMIFIAFISQILLALFMYIGTNLDPAPFWQYQKSWENIFILIPRIMLASWITFIITENLDAYLYAKIREFTKGKHLWARNVFSTIPSLTLDTIIFVSLAFYGTDLPLLELMIGQFIIKYLIGIINIPFMYANKFLLGDNTFYDKENEK